MRLVIGLMFFSATVFAQKNQSKTLDSLSQKLLGKWEYQYSVLNDSSFVVTNEDLVREYSFSKNTQSTIRNEVESYRSTRLFFELRCTVLLNGGAFDFFPASENGRDDIQLPVEMTLYYDRSGILKHEWFNIEELNKNILILTDERFYSVGTREVSGARHIYQKVKPQKRKFKKIGVIISAQQSVRPHIRQHHSNIAFYAP